MQVNEYIVQYFFGHDLATKNIDTFRVQSADSLTAKDLLDFIGTRLVERWNNTHEHKVAVQNIIYDFISLVNVRHEEV